MATVLSLNLAILMSIGSLLPSSGLGGAFMTFLSKSLSCMVSGTICLNKLKRASASLAAMGASVLLCTNAKSSVQIKANVISVAAVLSACFSRLLAMIIWHAQKRGAVYVHQ